MGPMDTLYSVKPPSIRDAPKCPYCGCPYSDTVSVTVSGYDPASHLVERTNVCTECGKKFHTASNYSVMDFKFTSPVPDPAPIKVVFGLDGHTKTESGENLFCPFCGNDSESMENAFIGNFDTSPVTMRLAVDCCCNRCSREFSVMEECALTGYFYTDYEVFDEYPDMIGVMETDEYHVRSKTKKPSMFRRKK